MTDLSITAANVGLAGITPKPLLVQVYEAVTQGQPGVRASTGKWGQGHATDADLDNVAGIFLTAAATDGFAVFAPTDSLIIIGATLTVGTTYYLSNTKGAICLYSDLSSNDYITPLGVAQSTTVLQFKPVHTQVQVP